MLVAVKTQTTKPVTSVLEVVGSLPVVKQEQLKPWTAGVDTRALMKDAHVAARLIAAMHGIPYREALKQGLKNAWEMARQGDYRKVEAAQPTKVEKVTAVVEAIAEHKIVENTQVEVPVVTQQVEHTQEATQPSKSFLEKAVEDWIPSRSEWDVQYLRRKLGASWKKYGETCKETQVKLKNFFEYLEDKFPEVVSSDTLVDLLRGDTQEEAPEDYEEIMYMVHGFDDHWDDAEMYHY